MKKGVLVCFGGSEWKNIGDYVQSLAARQFAGSDAVNMERESLQDYAGGPTKLIMNGWFMHHPTRFPPADDIRPLFVSFHVRPKIENRFFTEATVAYLRAHAPIGCRSTDAVEMMRRHGIEAEFSSCLTLTLGETYRHVESDSPPLFVDPFFLRFATRWWRTSAPLRILLLLPFILRHFRVVRHLASRFRVFRFWPGIRFAAVRWYYASEFLRAYSPVFSEDVLMSAAFATHHVSKRDYPTEAALFSHADELLRRYERAPYVVTSRLHCALPCLAMGTPAWVPYHPDMTTGRFGGNDAFMNTLPFGEDGRLRPLPGGRIRPGDVPPVRTDHRPYADALARRCRTFMEGE